MADTSSGSPAQETLRQRIIRLAAPAMMALAEVFSPQPPPRVAKAIAEAEERIEILVGWLQLAGIVLFFALYLLTHGAFMESGRFEPVPIALLAWGVFVAWRLRCAYRRAPSHSFLIIAAAMDILVLMVAIWSFTLQYDAPAALYLKGPTLYYAFIFIALRALRFDAAQVVATGVLASIGWLVLVAIAAKDAPVTSDYRVYMTSFAVLWGAEWEKIVAILAVTAILALGVARARALLISTNAESIAAADLSRFLDRSAAERVRSSDTALRPGDGELKPAAIMFIDLRGFSAAAAKLSPGETIELLREYQSRFVPVIEAAGGAVDKFMGDGMLVSFGTSKATSREAADAFAAIPALLAASDTWLSDRAAAGLPPLRVAVAIAHGPVVHGVIGHDDRLEFTVIGDAVNLAAKLEKHAKVEAARVIATREAWETARAQGAAGEPLRLVSQAAVEGVSTPVDLAVMA
ncbi:MAG TPA: adenylate/guanylate cyclase domain-containing protein [Hyphomonadaceae bacterium]|nr:adenylate/guanylate cyclase domain-containing protein [Hyphomonadaceae bacterium]